MFLDMKLLLNSKFYIFFALLTLCCSGFSDCIDLEEFVHIQRCDLNIKSQALTNSTVYVRAWKPKNVTANTPVIMFLHGRGYFVSSDQPNRQTMIEAMGLDTFLLSEAYQKNPALVMAPQDSFEQSDGNQGGNDYWLGADGRDWLTFLCDEVTEYVRETWGVSDKNWASAGISMGAHGSMMLATDYPHIYKSFVSLSPVFRSSEEEVPKGDHDVFYRVNAKNSDKLNDLYNRSKGARVLNNQNFTTHLLSRPHLIEIHESDFALNLPKASEVWDKLQNSTGFFPGKVQILSTPRESKGHDDKFWKDRLGQSLIWLLKSLSVET